IKVTGIKYARMDDLKLVTSADSPTCTITFGASSSAYPWAEMPQTVKSSANYKYVTHRGTTYSSKQSVRNYSACYDTRRHNPMWVAYPCHNIFWEGGYTRPNPDPWRPDPDFLPSEQSIIYATDWKDWPWTANGNKPTDNYYFWTPLGVDNDNYYVTVGKGHLMRSAERGAGVTNVLFGLNEQTFYPTNISPERNRYVAHWDAVEGLLPNNWRCSDTVYVVAGCYYENENTVLYDASNWNEHSSLSKPCVMPTAKYKVFLRTKSGSTGKNIAECSADELMAIGFWFPQELDPKVEVAKDKVTAPSLSTVIYSVADIEKMIGGEFKFFPTVPDAVKQSYNVSDWPGLASSL
ncbi:MAG: DNA/RNA non-specific endonuclease, partial [Candidatus Cryptobacteroides sp.]